MFIKDNLSQILEDKKIIEEVNLIKKKMDALQLSINEIRKNDENNHPSYSPTKGGAYDSSRYVENYHFEIFHKNYLKEMELLKKFTEESSRRIDDHEESLISKPSLKNLKEFKDEINLKFEEGKNLNIKKFADKPETIKDIKYLDTQLKYIIDAYIKKSEKGENWLIAKKPVGGFSCASCESYIGKLQEPSQHVSWNKYPQREQNEKAYRVNFLNFLH